jgi:ketosteroid isomerase-like protein
MTTHTRAALMGAALCMLASPLVAQTWSADQQAVLAVVDETWTENDATWVTRLTHPEMLGWGNTQPVPRDQATTGRWSDHGLENSTGLLHSLAPVGIVIRGDVAIVHYYASVSEEDREGKRETTTSRCTDTLTRDSGSWLYLGWFCFDEPSEGN